MTEAVPVGQFFSNIRAMLFDSDEPHPSTPTGAHAPTAEGVGTAHSAGGATSSAAAPSLLPTAGGALHDVPMRGRGRCPDCNEWVSLTASGAVNAHHHCPTAGGGGAVGVARLGADKMDVDASEDGDGADSAREEAPAATRRPRPLATSRRTCPLCSKQCAVNSDGSCRKHKCAAVEGLAPSVVGGGSSPTTASSSTTAPLATHGSAPLASGGSVPAGSSLPPAHVPVAPAPSVEPPFPTDTHPFKCPDPDCGSAYANAGSLVRHGGLAHGWDAFTPILAAYLKGKHGMVQCGPSCKKGAAEGALWHHPRHDGYVPHHGDLCETFAGHRPRFAFTDTLVKEADTLVQQLPTGSATAKYHAPAVAMKQVLQRVGAGDRAGAALAAHALFEPHLLERKHKPLPDGVSRASANAARAHRALKRGAIGKAMHALQAGELFEVDSPANEDKVRQLAPGGDAPSCLTFEDRKICPPRLSNGATKHIVCSKDSHSAPGPSGISYGVLQRLRKVLGNVWIRAVRILSQLILEGYFDGTAAAARLSACALTLLKKEVGDKPRPIGIGEVLANIARSHAAGVVARRLAEKHIHDFGLARSAGVEAAIRSVTQQLEEHPTHVALGLDSSNAFGSVYREAIRAGAEALAPELLSSLFSLYASPSAAYFSRSDGSVSHVLFSRGVRQGDALGPLLFMIALIPILEDIRRQFPDVHIPSYLDDLVLAGTQERVLEALAALKPRLEGIGLRLNPAKSKLLVPAEFPAVQRAAMLAAGISATNVGESMPLLGAMIGNHVHVKEFLQGKAEKFRQQCDAVCDAAPLLGSHSHIAHGLFKVLRFCAVPSIAHLFRTHRPSDTAFLADSAASATLDAVCRLLGVNRPLEASLAEGRVFAPLASGGLGFPDPRVTHLAGFAAGMVQTADAAFPGIWDLDDAEDAAALLFTAPELEQTLEAIAARVAGPNASTDARREAHDRVLSTMLSKSKGLQRQLAHAMASASAERAFSLEPEKAMRAVQRCGMGAESWCPYTVDHSLGARLADDVFRCAALLRTGFPFHAGRSECGRCKGPASPSIVHDLNCPSLHSFGVTYRHSKVQSALLRATRRVGIVSGVSFSTETPKYDDYLMRKATAPTPKVRQGDLRVTFVDSGRFFDLDFTVSGVTQANVAAAEATTGAIAVSAEKSKFADLEAHYHVPDSLRPRFRPVALSFTGTMAPHARFVLGAINDAYVPTAVEEADEEEAKADAVPAVAAPPSPEHGLLADPSLESFDRTARGRRLWRLKAEVVRGALEGTNFTWRRYLQTDGSLPAGGG